MSKIKLGCSLFCFTQEYAQGRMDFKDCVRAAAEIGAEGYEIVATQMIPSYPDVSEGFLDMVEDCRQRFGIAPVCYAANMDRGMRPDRDLSEDEMLERAIKDLYSAKKLGCKVVRQQFLVSPGAMLRLAPYAEELDIRVGIEIHNPETPDAPAILAYREAYEQSGSKHIGFIPDFGLFATKPNKPMWDKALAAGEKLEVLELAADCRRQDLPREEAMQRLHKAGAKGPAFAVLSGMYGFVQFRQDCQRELDGLRDILPQSFEMHAKCHYVSESLEEASIPYDRIIPVIRDGGYEGYLMAEYENEGGYPGREMAGRLLAMMKKLLKQNQ